MRVILELDGEVVVKATPDIGFLHRGLEKLAENKTYHQCIPLTDRLDYVAGMSNNLAYVLAVEKLLGLEVPPRAQAIRVLLSELQRISSHLLWLGTHAHDIGAMTPLFYALRERDEILFMFEMICGSRLTPSYFRVGGLAQDLPEGLEEKGREFTRTFNAHVDEYETLLTKNKIWMKRTQGVGVISARRGHQLGPDRPDPAGLQRELGPAQGHALQRIRELRFHRPHGKERRCVRPVPGADDGDAPVQ